MMLKALLAINLLLNSSSNTDIVLPSPKIIKFYTNIEEKDNWIQVPKGMEEIEIHVEASNTETVLFWLIPTGTATWNERKLIGIDINDDGDNIFSISWTPPGQLHDHLHVQAIGENEITSSILNISTDP